MKTPGWMDREGNHTTTLADGLADGSRIAGSPIEIGCTASPTDGALTFHTIRRRFYAGFLTKIPRSVEEPLG